MHPFYFRAYTTVLCLGLRTHLLSGLHNRTVSGSTHPFYSGLHNRTVSGFTHPFYFRAHTTVLCLVFMYPFYFRAYTTVLCLGLCTLFIFGLTQPYCVWVFMYPFCIVVPTQPYCVWVYAPSLFLGLHNRIVFWFMHLLFSGLHNRPVFRFFLRVMHLIYFSSSLWHPYFNLIYVPAYFSWAYAP
jgi:hypothetical protein